MGDGVVWGIVFLLSALAGIGGLILLHRSALHDALAQAARRETEEADRLKEDAAQAAGQLSEAMRTLEAANATRRALEDEMRAKDAALAAGARALLPYRANEAGLAARLAEMEAVWFDTGRSEDDCQKVLARNLWVLAPDYEAEPGFHIDGRTWISTAFENHFGRPRGDWVGGAEKDHPWQLRVGPDGRPDLCGHAKAATGFGGPENVYLILELKRPGIVIGWEHIEQAHAYALSLMMNVGPDLLPGERRIDCLVIGSAVGANVNDAHLRWGKEAHHAIRIVPMSYRQLHERARLMAAPFLGRAFAETDAAVPAIARIAAGADAGVEAAA